MGGAINCGICQIHLLYLFPLWSCIHVRNYVTTVKLVSNTDCGCISTNTTYLFFIKAHKIPASILYKSIAGRYRPVSYPDGPIKARYRFIKNAYWDDIFFFFFFFFFFVFHVNHMFVPWSHTFSLH